MTKHLTREDCRTIAEALAAHIKLTDFTLNARPDLATLLNELGDDGLRLYGAVLADRASCCCVDNDCDCLTWRSADYPLEYVIEADMVPTPWECQLQIAEECGERAELFVLDDGERRMACEQCYADHAVSGFAYKIEGRIEWSGTCSVCSVSVVDLIADVIDHDRRSGHEFVSQPRVTVEATGKAAPEPRRGGGQ
jgi:hypothetical protein